MEYKVGTIRFEMKSSLCGDVTITNNGGSKTNVPLAALIEFLGEVWRQKEIQKLINMPALRYIGSRVSSGDLLEELVNKLNPLPSELWQKDFEGDRGQVK